MSIKTKYPYYLIIGVQCRCRQQGNNALQVWVIHQLTGHRGPKVQYCFNLFRFRKFERPKDRNCESDRSGCFPWSYGRSWGHCLFMLVSSMSCPLFFQWSAQFYIDDFSFLLESMDVSLLSTYLFMRFWWLITLFSLSSLLLLLFYFAKYCSFILGGQEGNHAPVDPFAVAFEGAQGFGLVLNMWYLTIYSINTAVWKKDEIVTRKVTWKYMPK